MFVSCKVWVVSHGASDDQIRDSCLPPRLSICSGLEVIPGFHEKSHASGLASCLNSEVANPPRHCHSFRESCHKSSQWGSIWGLLSELDKWNSGASRGYYKKWACLMGKSKCEERNSKSARLRNKVILLSSWIQLYLKPHCSWIFPLL